MNCKCRRRKVLCLQDNQKIKAEKLILFLFESQISNNNALKLNIAISGLFLLTIALLVPMHKVIGKFLRFSCGLVKMGKVNQVEATLRKAINWCCLRIHKYQHQPSEYQKAESWSYQQLKISKIENLHNCLLSNEIQTYLIRELSSCL